MWRLRWISPLWRRYSYDVKTELVKSFAAFTGLLALAAAQDLAPTVFGAKPPLLLVFGCIAGAPVAVAAGLFVDALGGLPFGCSAIFFLAAALLSRFLKPFAFLVAILSAALYQVWLGAWGGNAPFITAYVAFAYAAVLFPLVRKAFLSVKLHTGIHQCDKENLK